MYPYISLSPILSIPTYYLILSVAVSIALVWIVRRAEGPHDIEFNVRRVLDLGLIVMVTGFLGGRLFHVIYEEPTYYLDNPGQILAFWNGGFVFYGGALLAGFCALLYLYKLERSHLGRYLDLFAPVIAFTYAMGRGACLLTGCCFGKYCELPWAINSRHPTQAYAALWEIGVIFILLGLEKYPHRAGKIFSLWMVLHGIGRLLMELFRDDFRGPSLGFSISGWISLAVVATGLFFFFRKTASPKDSLSH